MKNSSIQELRNRPWVADYQPPAPPDENSNVRFSLVVADSKNPILHNRCYPMHVIMVIRWRRPRRRSRERSKLRKQNCRNSCRKVSAGFVVFFRTFSFFEFAQHRLRCKRMPLYNSPSLRNSGALEAAFYSALVWAAHHCKVSSLQAMRIMAAFVVAATHS